MDELTKDFKDSLIYNSGDLVSEYAEIGIDNIISGDLLKEIPIVKSLVAVLKIGKNVHDRNLLKQTITFINEFNNGTNANIINKHKLKIERDDKKYSEELERVLLLLNNFIDTEKSIMLSKLFKSYLNKYVLWNEFCEYSEIVNRLFLQDIEVLKLIYDGTISDTTNRRDLFRVERLKSLGIVGFSFKPNTISMMINGNRGGRQDSYLVLNSNGKKFMDIIS